MNATILQSLQIVITIFIMGMLLGRYGSKWFYIGEWISVPIVVGVGCHVTACSALARSDLSQQILHNFGDALIASSIITIAVGFGATLAIGKTEKEEDE